ncbi:helix-turn-helix domain-containing protein [Lactococcus lactis]|uniref:helix-turn-helix domain-containing protein n=1 Tax=Lactococcus lactis TaxID=1358 RepID=UPI00241839C5|nr:helix-turn-helix transcriptional regulator [Lactococcus lactis]MDG4967544.1 helix-turn-helix domain-containing protein [Lactococcus lactis]
MRFVSRYTFKDLRQLNRLSLEQVADKTDISIERLELLESDSSLITGKELNSLSNLYDINLDYVFLGKQSDFDKKLSEYLGGTP